MEEEQAGIWQRTYEIWTAALNAAYRDLGADIVEFIPSLLGAMLILLVGWAVAFGVRSLILRASSTFDRLFQAAGLGGKTVLPTNWPASKIVAHSAFWLIILFFISVAASVLSLPGVADVFRHLLLYLPVILLLALGTVVVYGLSRMVSDLAVRAGRANGVGNPVLLGRIVRGLVLAFALSIAIEKLGLDVSLFVSVVSIAVAAILGGAALAFGLGAGTIVRNMIASHFLRQLYHVGQRVRIEDVEGEILELTASAVVIDAVDGRTVIPARRFLTSNSVLLGERVR